MAGTFILIVPGFKMAAVIRRKEHNRVVIQLKTFEGIYQSPKGFINPFNHAVIPTQLRVSIPA